MVASADWSAVFEVVLQSAKVAGAGLSPPPSFLQEVIIIIASNGRINIIFSFSISSFYLRALFQLNLKYLKSTQYNYFQNVERIKYTNYEMCR